MAAAYVDDDWSSNSTESTTISLVHRPLVGVNEDGTPKYGPLKTSYTFHPTYTHQLFGDQETIFGYKDLDMEIQISEDTLFTHFKSSHAAKFPKQGDTEADDVEDIWKEVLEADSFVPESEFENALPAHAQKYKLPPGHMIKAIDTDATTRYEVWQGPLTDARVFEAMAHIDFLNPLLIDGGTTITEAPDAPMNANWTVFFLYKRTGNTHVTLVGYATVWSLFNFNAADLGKAKLDPEAALPAGDEDLKLPRTRRLAQFVILPPFQRQGLSHKLYSTIYAHYRRDEDTRLITVESPSNAFDDVRDICDLNFIRGLESAPQIIIDTAYRPPPADRSGAALRPVFEKSKVLPMTMLKSLLGKTKMAPRQFWRVIELHLMSQLPESVQPSLNPTKTKSTAEDRHVKRLWGMIVKERIARENSDTLAELDHDDRVHHLNQTLSTMGEDYARILDLAERVKEARKESEEKLARSLIEAEASTAGKRKASDAAHETSKRLRAEELEE